MKDVIKNKYQGPLDNRTESAFTRTRLAADRTLLSWIRTSFSMISFGFAIIKFFQYLKPIESHPHRHGDTKHLGAFLILLGIGSLIPAMIQHRKELRAISKIDKGPSWNFSLVIAIIVGVIGVYALLDAVLIRLF